MEFNIHKRISYYPEATWYLGFNFVIIRDFADPEIDYEVSYQGIRLEIHLIWFWVELWV